MSSSQILTGKHVVIFGAGGSIGTAVAKEMAGQGAEVFLAGRTKGTLEELTASISAAGGRAHSAVVDALDDLQVNDYVERVVREAGHIDAVFNAVGPRAADYGNGKHAVDLRIEEFMVPATTVLKTQFIAARAAARHMIKQRSGVIIFLTGSPARGHVEGASAIGAAFGAIESLMENMALELGQHGVRVVCLRTTANVDSQSIQDTFDALTSKLNVTKDQMIAQMASLNFLKISARVQDTANAAVLLASDRARMISGTVVNCTAGAAVD